MVGDARARELLARLLAPRAGSTGRVTLAQALFAPRAVALVGASGDAAKNTARPLRFLRKHGYGGRIVAINAIRSQVLGERPTRTSPRPPARSTTPS